MRKQKRAAIREMGYDEYEHYLKTRRRRRWIKFAAVVGAVVFIFGTFAVVNVFGNRANTKMAESIAAVTKQDALEPVWDAEASHWVFTTDREFKVLQLTDIHIGGGFMSFKKDYMALNAVALMITAERPDLVIVTGDIAYPVPFQSGSFNNLAATKVFASLMQSLGVYWTVALGNHDAEAYSYYTRDKIAEYYASGLDYCLFTRGPADIAGEGNQVIEVRNSQGLITRSFFVFDSHSYTDGDILGVQWKYDNIKQSQVDWYSAEVGKMNAKNAAVLGTLNDADLTAKFSTVKSLAFFHIPLVEMLDAWQEYKNNGSQDTADVKFIYGVAGESKKTVFCGIGEDELFETILELESTQGLFFGHDHLNNFSLEYKGIRMTYSPSIDYLAYFGIQKLGSQRGCTVITSSPNGSWSCKAENYYQDKYWSPDYEKEKVEMQWAN